MFFESKRAVAGLPDIPDTSVARGVETINLGRHLARPSQRTRPPRQSLRWGSRARGATVAPIRIRVGGLPWAGTGVLAKRPRAHGTLMKPCEVGIGLGIWVLFWSYYAL